MSEKNVSEIYIPRKGKKKKLPFFVTSISAGFPSPADDYIDKKLDLNEYLIKNPSSTFYVRVEGDSMIDAGIHSKDILIVDRSLEPKNKKIILAILNGEFTVKRLIKKGKTIALKAENPKYPNIKVKNDMDFQVWGIVTTVIHKV
ncbi:MAG: translesion error-prone DNA polymerase V autoproteolytic subunit [Candidatus Mcinerneyibacterium aminivorans]|jgi:DNA polymerase V|uniref:Translesion error-prone DNA polymerase V autoproteolytic subunit n=1 Tax=Candidatus Mcinerneyibacterium aminivorans TaxID=2703815 RepID=A0A5D0MLP4_9BACT|nr:MAG: translesion error-prone DNA polymerase V autoproteolytic subunit [Candidatus Mcinerneyibacterium aminivorans]